MPDSSPFHCLKGLVKLPPGIEPEGTEEFDRYSLSNKRYGQLEWKDHIRPESTLTGLDWMPSSTLFDLSRKGQLRVAKGHDLAEP